MAVRSVIVFLLFSASLFAQKKVSEICAKQKLQCDSIMRMYYGDYLFENYFRFDGSSNIEYKNHRYHWDDTITIDTNYIYIIRYRFEFPGADNSFKPLYVLSNNPKLDRSWGINPKFYSGRCEIQDSGKLGSIAQKELKQPLNRCEVELVDFATASRHAEQPLDSTHVYLLVKYTKSKTPFYNVCMAKIHVRSMIVDGCTGQIISRNKRRYKVFMHF